MNDMEKAKALLAEGGYTCAACKGDEEYVSTQRGVRPLLELIDARRSLAGYSAADRVVGRAAAYLYVELEVSRVYAQVMSRAAQEVFERFGVEHGADTVVDAIANRTNTGLCPMESAVWDITDVHEAELAIRKKVKELMAT